jgi:uncharacterized protein
VKPGEYLCWMTAPLPPFRYHPDPIRSGSVAESSAKCRCCSGARGFIYTGPVYSEADDLDDAICPWCIADGSAHERFDATFYDEQDIPDVVAPDAVAEVATRTPGFDVWQNVEWPVCCDDLMAFIEPAGHAEIQRSHLRLEGQIITHIVHELGISGGAAHQYYRKLNRGTGPTAYIFKCVHCDGWAVRMDGP